MNKLKHKQASVRLNKTSIVIYYSFAGEEMRFPTGVTIPLVKDKSGSLKYWDSNTKKLRINYNGGAALIPIMQNQQKTIDGLLEKANTIIDESFQDDIVITVDELKRLMATSQDEKFQKASISFFEYMYEFLEMKRKHFSIRGVPISLKDYKSTYRLLQDFQAVKSHPIKIKDVTTNWLHEFVQYMYIKHDKFIGDYRVSSKGEMKESTIKKRLDILSEFFGFLKEKKVVTAYEVDIIKLYKKTIKKQVTDKETLDIDEIHKLYLYQFDQKNHEEIRDIFVFLCLTGMRYQDLILFDKRFIVSSKEGDGRIYKRQANKTGINYNIPLCAIVEKIILKYDYQMPKITGQYGNRLIKEALKITGMFEDYTQIVDKATKEFKQRFEAITLHKGRNSFITNLVDVTPLNELMKYTGHRKLSTLQGYINTNRPVKMDYVKIFDLA